MSATSTADREIVTSRLVNAPRELVWEAWTNPRHVIHWWGPDGFTNTIHEMEVKPGGVWRFMMHGPNGTDFPNKIVFTEVIQPEKLVFMHSDDNEPPKIMFHNSVVFEKVGDKTNIIMTALFASAEERDKIAKEAGAVEGGKQTLRKLEEYLATMEN